MNSRIPWLYYVLATIQKTLYCFYLCFMIANYIYIVYILIWIYIHIWTSFCFGHAAVQYLRLYITCHLCVPANFETPYNHKKFQTVSVGLDHNYAITVITHSLLGLVWLILQADLLLCITSFSRHKLATKMPTLLHQSHGHHLQYSFFHL